MVVCRGIRGATTVVSNTAEDISSRTQELVEVLVSENDLRSEDIAAVIFTVPADITVMFPTKAVRKMGWDNVPMIDAFVPAITGDLPLCLRVLILVNTDRPQAEIKWRYLHGANVLRPDK